MNKKRSSAPVFKPYRRGQPQLLPPDLEEVIPAGHLVRVVDAAIERMDLAPLRARYKGGGASSFDPKMMLKVLIYAYSQRIWSSRQIAKALRENVYFMWLSAQNRPDFRTINRFRGVVLGEIMPTVFTSVLGLLIEEGYVKLETYFLDGTKIQASAHRYRAVWAKSSRRYRQQLRAKVSGLLEEIEQVNQREDDEYGDRDLEEMGGDGPIDPEKLERTIGELNERLRQQPSDKKLAKAVRTLKGDYLPRVRKYEEQERKLAGRNSYSPTDPDATFMRMKGDPLGQAKPAYNVQLGTEDEFIVGYSLHQRPGDTRCLIPHLEALKERLGRLPRTIVADAAYGSQDNYAYLEEQGLGNYVKYTFFNRDERRRRQDGLLPERDPGDDGKDGPAGPIFERLKRRARENLLSERGRWLRARRGVEVEGVFGRLKHNWGFRRFLLRGLKKAETEWGLLCIAHNLAKLATRRHAPPSSPPCCLLALRPRLTAMGSS